MLDGMVERQMRKSISAIGCIWYSAWIDASNMDEWQYKKMTKKTLHEAKSLNDI